jgi:hypothetical protein
MLCNRSLKKGDAYWKHREYYTDEDDGKFSTLDWNECSRCKYREEDQAFRRMDLHMRCAHPSGHVVYEGNPDDYNGYVCLICCEQHLIKDGDVYTTADEGDWK